MLYIVIQYFRNSGFNLDTAADRLKRDLLNSLSPGIAWLYSLLYMGKVVIYMWFNFYVLQCDRVHILVLLG